MKLVVVSDSHGDRDVLVDLLKHYEGKVDGIFHCGDSELPGDDLIWEKFTAHVGGNCDFDKKYLPSVITKLENETIYLTHGHLSDVRYGLGKLSYQAQEKGATIALFGHTHELGCEYENDMLFLNPGSILLPRGPRNFQSYAIIETSEDSYQVTYYNRQHQAIDNLSFVFKKSK